MIRVEKEGIERRSVEIGILDKHITRWNVLAADRERESMKMLRDAIQAGIKQSERMIVEAAKNPGDEKADRIIQLSEGGKLKAYGEILSDIDSPAKKIDLAMGKISELKAEIAEAKQHGVIH